MRPMVSAPPPGPHGTITRTLRCGQSSARAGRVPASIAAAETASRLRRVSMSDGAARAVCSPPPCGEGLGVGVVRYFAVGAIVISPHYPPLPTPPPQGGREQTELASHGYYRISGAATTRPETFLSRQWLLS